VIAAVIVVLAASSSAVHLDRILYRSSALLFDAMLDGPFFSMSDLFFDTGSFSGKVCYLRQPSWFFFFTGELCYLRQPSFVLSAMGLEIFFLCFML